MYQSVVRFESLPSKLQAVWLEEWDEPSAAQTFIVCSWWGTEAGLFSEGNGFCFQSVESNFPSMPDLRYCSRVEYAITGDQLQFFSNEPITDNREESWVDYAAEELIALSKLPGLEDEDGDANATTL